MKKDTQLMKTGMVVIFILACLLTVLGIAEIIMLTKISKPQEVMVIPSVVNQPAEFMNDPWKSYDEGNFLLTNDIKFTNGDFVTLYGWVVEPGGEHVNIYTSVGNFNVNFWDLYSSKLINGVHALDLDDLFNDNQLRSYAEYEYRIRDETGTFDNLVVQLWYGEDNGYRTALALIPFGLTQKDLWLIDHLKSSKLYSSDILDPFHRTENLFPYTACRSMAVFDIISTADKDYLCPDNH